MKKRKFYRDWIFMIPFLFLLITACEKSITEEEQKPKEEDQLTETNAEKALNSLVFENASMKSGNIPTGAADFKIDRDSIFMVEGVKNRIKFLNPNLTVGISSFYVSVVGADGYYEVEAATEEETDSIGVLYIEFNPDEWELPASFTIKIVPKDENGDPGNGSEVPVEVEDPNAPCNFSPGDYLWEWISTSGNGDFVLAPMYAQITQGVVSGCCDTEGNSYYSDCSGTLSHREVAYETIFMVSLEFLKFFDGGLVAGELHQFTQNLDVSATDFCGGNPGYKLANVFNSYNGTYTNNPGDCTITIESLEGQTEPIYDSYGNYYGEAPLPVYAGSGAGVTYKLISKHFMKEIRSVEGAGIERVYEARSSELKWYD